MAAGRLGDLRTVSTSTLLTIALPSAVPAFAHQGRMHQPDLRQPFAPEHLVFMILRDLPELPAVALVLETLQAIAGANDDTQG